MGVVFSQVASTIRAVGTRLPGKCRRDIAVLGLRCTATGRLFIALSKSDGTSKIVRRRPLHRSSARVTTNAVACPKLFKATID